MKGTNQRSYAIGNWGDQLSENSYRYTQPRKYQIRGIKGGNPGAILIKMRQDVGSDCRRTKVARCRRPKHFASRFWSWLLDTLLSCRMYSRPTTQRFVRASRHLKPEDWHQVEVTRGQCPREARCLLPQSPQGNRTEGPTPRIRPGGATAEQRRFHRFACATIGTDCPYRRARKAMQAALLGC